MDFDLDPRDIERDETREIDMPWIELGRGPGSAREEDDPRDRDEDGRDRNRESRERDPDDPREAFLNGLELPRGPEREIVLDGDHRYELNGEDSRTLATVGAFRVVAERDLRDLRDESSEALDALDAARWNATGNGNGAEKAKNDEEIPAIIEVSDELTSQSRHSCG